MQNEYQVMVYKTPMSFPLSFACHTWVEVSDGGVVDRYDLWAYPGLKIGDKNKDYIYRNIFPNRLGVTFSPFASPDDASKRQVGKIYSSIKGGEGSKAQRLYGLIQEKAFDYPLSLTYKMIQGPNCNTYTQWLIGLVPNSGLKLPFCAWGKNFNF